MGEETKIAWTATVLPDGTIIIGGTWNCWIGCAPKSEGCKNCYAEALAERYGFAKWGVLGTRKRTSQHLWNEPVRWDKQAALGGYRKKVFCASLADLFEQRDELTPWRKDAFAVIAKCNNLDWLLLTKRIENVNAMIEEAVGQPADRWLADHPNVWIGASMENQKRTDERKAAFLAVNAAVRFVSVEPMLGAVSFRDWEIKPSWVIVGGESGNGARLMALDDAEALISECREDGIPVFFKQTGAVLAKMLGLKHRKGEDPAEWPTALNVRQYPR